MTTTNLDGSTSPYVIAAGSVVQANDGDALLAQGSIEDEGTIALNGTGTFTGAPTPAEIAALILASPTVTLGGGGTLLLAGGMAADVFGSLPAETLVNADTITGAGVIGVPAAVALSSSLTAEPLALVNGPTGTIDATGTLALVLGGAVLSNAGLLEAGAGGTLAITGASLDNTGGLILATGGGLVALADVSLSGGQITTASGGGVAFVGGGNTLTGAGGTATLGAGTALTLAVGASLALGAATLDNAGTFTVDGELTLAQPAVTFAGGGTIGFAGSIDANTASVLVNADNTVAGPGALVGSLLSLTNDAAGVLLGTTLDLTGAVRNLGVMRDVTIGLGVAATTIDNAGGTLLAAAGTVALYDANILGGTLAAGAGGVVADGQGLLGTGNLTLDGSAAAVTIAAGTTLRAWNAADFPPPDNALAQNLTFLGTVDLLGTVEALNTAPAAGGTFANLGVLVAGPAAAIAGTLANAGTVVVASGTFGIAGSLGGGGTVALAAGATLALGAGSANTIDFGGNAGATLLLGAGGAGFTGTLANLASGDTIGLAGVKLASASIVAGTTLALGLAGGGTLAFALAGATPGLTATIAADTAALPAVFISCFAAGTRLATPRGPVAVEALRLGDTLLTAAGRHAPVRWLGHRRVDCARHPRPPDVRPVRVRAGAFGPGLPARDLFLSPDHALFLDGVLIPVRHLIDGVAVAPVARPAVTYFHVELDRHDVVLAEGLACESFLDTGQRAAFAGGPTVALHPDFAARAWDGDACAPLVVAGPALARARARLRGFPSAPSLVAAGARP